MKYADEGVVRTLIVEKHSFKGIENYFTNSFYHDSFETVEDPSPEDPDSGNEADTEPEPEEECLREINLFVTSIDKLDLNNTANDVGEWFINENLDLAYLSALASESVPSDISTDIDSDPLSAIDALTSLQAPIRSSFMVQETAEEIYEAFFNVPARYKGQKPIFFGLFKPEPMTRESSEDSSKSPQFSHYGQNPHRMMKKKGYDLAKWSGLNFNKGKQALL